MPTKYRREIREKARVCLRERGREVDARRIGKKTSMEKLRLLLSFDDLESMYRHFDHEPSINNPNGGPDNPPVPCYLLFGDLHGGHQIREWCGTRKTYRPRLSR